MPVRRLCVEVSRSILLLQVLCVPWVQVYIYMYALSQNKIAVNVQRKENVYGSEYVDANRTRRIYQTIA